MYTIVVYNTFYKLLYTIVVYNAFYKLLYTIVVYNPHCSIFTWMVTDFQQCRSTQRLSIKKCPNYMTGQCNLAAMQCSVLQYSGEHWSTVQYIAVQCSTVQFIAVQCSTLQWCAVFSVTQYCRVQFSAAQCSLLWWPGWTTVTPSVSGRLSDAVARITVSRNSLLKIVSLWIVSLETVSLKQFFSFFYNHFITVYLETVSRKQFLIKQSLFNNFTRNSFS